MRVLSVVVFGAVLSGCSAAYLSAKQGQEALDRGDVEGALAHYYSACRQSDDKDWCERADRLHNDMKGAVIAEAIPLCGQAGKEKPCLDTLKRLRRFKDDPQLANLADAAGKGWLEKCRATQIATPVEAVTRVRCVETLHADVMTAGYDGEVRAERLKMAQFVAQESRTASTKGFVVAGYGLAELARCFSELAPVSVEAARAAATEQLQVRAAVAADGIVASAWVCGQLGKNSDGRIVCSSSGTRLGLRVGLQRSELAHYATDTGHDVTYVAERRQYDNPEWFRLDHIRERDEHRARKARHEAKLAADNCETATRDLNSHYCTNCELERSKQKVCKYAHTLDEFADEARRDLRNSEYALERTRRYLVQEITANYHYVERSHLWQQRFQASVAGSGVSVRGRDFAFDLKRSGVDRDAFDPADISGSIAQVPSQSELDSEALGEVAEALASWAKEAQAVVAREREAECSKTAGSLAASLECTASVSYLQGRDAASAYVAALGREVDRVATYPAAMCAR